MMTNEFDSKELFEPRVTSSPSAHHHYQQQHLTPSASTTYVKYGANDLELTTSNVRLVATPTHNPTPSTLSKKRKLDASSSPSTQDMEKLLRKINSSIMKNVEKRRGCSFNSQKNTQDNVNFLKTAFRQTSGSLINDNKNSFDLICCNQHQFDTLTTGEDVNTLEMLDSMDLPALPVLVPKRRKVNPAERLNFKRGLEIYLNKQTKKKKKSNRADSFISSIASFSVEKSHQLCSTCSTSYFISTIDNSSYLSRDRSLLSSQTCSSCNCSCQKPANNSYTSGHYETIDNHLPLVPNKKPTNRSMTFDVKMASTPKSFRKRKELLISKLFAADKSSAKSTLSSSLISTTSSSTKIEQAHSYESLVQPAFNNLMHNHAKCQCSKPTNNNYFVEQRVQEDNCNMHFHQHQHHHHHLYLNQVQLPFDDQKCVENMMLNHRSSTLKRAKKPSSMDTELTKSHLVDCNGYFKQLLKLKLKNKKLAAEGANFQKLKLKTTVKPLATQPHGKSDILRIAKRQPQHCRALTQRCSSRQPAGDIKHHIKKLEAIKQRSVKTAERNLLAVNQNLLESSMNDMFPMNNNEFNQFGQFQVWWV